MFESWLFLLVCFLALLALAALFLVAFQLQLKQAAWGAKLASRQEQLQDIEEQIADARVVSQGWWKMAEAA